MKKAGIIRKEILFTEEEWRLCEEFMRKNGYKQFSSCVRSLMCPSAENAENEAKNALYVDTADSMHLTINMSEKHKETFTEAMRIKGYRSRSLFFRRVMIPYLEDIVERNEIDNLVRGDKTLFERLKKMQKKIERQDEEIRKVEILFQLLNTHDTDKLKKDLENFEFWMQKMTDAKEDLRRDFIKALEIIGKKPNQ